MRERITRRGMISVAGAGLVGGTTGDVTAQQSSLTADFSYSPEIPQRGESVTFDPSPSTASNGSIRRFRWLIGSLVINQTFAKKPITHSFDSKGTYNVELRIADTNGNTASTVKSIEVGNTPPDASMSVTPENPNPGETVILSAQSTTDPENNIAVYRWQVADEQKTGQEIEHTFSEEGKKAATLTVEDTEGATDSTTVETYVGDKPSVSIPPVAIGAVGVGGIAGYYYLNRDGSGDENDRGHTGGPPRSAPKDGEEQQNQDGNSSKSYEDNQGTPDHLTKEHDDENSNQNKYVKEPPEIDFSNVAGNADLIDELRDKVVSPLENPEKYDEYGLSVETGFLLYGPPGTGKTYTTKALAGELGRNWMPVKGSDLNSTIVGGGTENIAEMFDEARENQPVLLFLDEIDQLTPERGGHNQHEDTTKQVNTMLEEVSAIHDSDNDIVVVGATNRPDRIDDAMLRSGRLTTQIEVSYPDEEARINIFQQHLEAPQRNLRLREIADASEGLSAADMEAVATEAARLALKRDEPVDTDDVLTAIRKIRSN